MKEKKYTTEELLSDESFIAYVKFGHNKAQWERHLNDPENKQVIQEAKAIIEALKIRDEGPSQLAQDRIRRNIDARIKPVSRNLFENGNHNIDNSGTKKIWYVAAVVVLMILGSVSYFYVAEYGRDEVVQQNTIVKSTQPGQKLTVSLPDGSRVKLNANSLIRYPENFTSDIRKVALSGEAFFEVERNVKKPFIVESGALSTHVLGTSFNIRSYPGESTLNVILAAGKIQVISNNGDKEQSVLLEPGMKVDYIRETHKMIKAEADLEKDLLWKEGIILFEGASRNEVFDKLENWYGVTFDLSGYVQENGWHYSARFDNKNLEHVLQSISYVKKFSYEIENDKVIINKN